MFIWLLLASASPTRARPAYAGPDGPVSLLVAQADGGVLVGGRFTHFAGRPCPGGLARLRPDGRPDTTFALPAAWRAYGRLHPTALAPLPDGRVVAAFTLEQLICRGCPVGNSRDFLVRLLPDGQPDTSFVPAVQPVRPLWRVPMSLVISALALQPDGRLLVAGRLPHAVGDTLPPYRHLLRLLPDGRLDAGFRAELSLKYTIERLAVQPDGRLVFAHGVTGYLARLLPNGQPDPSFAPRQAPRAYPPPRSPQPVDWDGGYTSSLLACPDGTLLLGGGEDAHPTPGPARSLARLLPNGHRDPSFKPTRNAGDIGISVLVQQPNGCLLAAYTRYEPEDSYALDAPTALRDAHTAARFMAAWQAERARVQAVRARAQWLRRWLPTGQPDPTFSLAGQQPPDGQIWALAVLPDGRLLAGGEFTCYNEVDTPYLVCLRPDGRPVPAFTR